MKTGIALFVLATVLSLGPPAHAQRKPNIIVILADDAGPEVEECMIQRAPHCALGGANFMPNLKSKVVDKGLRFTNSFVVEALCCPSRVATLRGQYPHSTGVEGNTYPGGGFEEFYRNGMERSTIATWLNNGGYETGLFGKYLNGYGERTNPSRYPVTWVPPGWDEWHGANSYFYYDFCLIENKGNTNGGDFGRVNFYSSSGGPPVQVPGPFYDICFDNSSGRGNQSASYISDVLTALTTNFMGQSVQRNKPFFAYVTPYIPHLPATVAPRHLNLFQGAAAPRGASYNEADVSDKPWPFNNNFNNPFLSVGEQATIDALFRRRLQTNMAVDDMVRALLDKAQSLGVADNTYLIFTSDNGYHLGQHRHVGFPGFVEYASGKGSMYEEDMRVPMYIVGPGVAAGQVRQQVVLNTDLAPTIAALAGVPGADGYTFEGRSMVPLFGGNAPNGRVNFLMESGDVFSDLLSYFKWGLKLVDVSLNRDWTYTEYYPDPSIPPAAPSNDTREFYDLKLDPLQLRNGYDALPQNLRQVLAARTAALAHCSGASCAILENAPLTQPSGIAVTVDPPSVNLRVGTSAVFRARVYGTANTAVAWSVPGGPSAGTIDGNGRYTAPLTPGFYEVRATALADPSKIYNVAVRVRTAPFLNISPGTVTLGRGQAYTFRAVPVGALPVTPRWGILENNTSLIGGTIAGAGLTALYTAPAVSGIFHVGAASNYLKAYATVVVVDQPQPVLQITKTHTGNFFQGQTNAAYTVRVSNAVGAAPTTGTVTVTDTLPPGLSLVSMSGNGWNCSGRTCTRGDALAGGGNYPDIQVLVNVGPGATSPQVNTVTVSGGGSGPATALDSTIISSFQPLAARPAAAFRDTFGQLRVTLFGDNSTVALGGTFASNPASAQGPGGEIWSAVRVSGGGLFLNRLQTSGESDWYGLGGVFQGDPAIAVAADGTVWVVARDLYNALWIYKFDPATGAQPGVFAGGIVDSDFDLVLGDDGVLTAAARDAWGGVWLARYDTAAGSMLGWVGLGGITSGAPSATIGSDNAVYVAVRDTYSGTWVCRYAGGSTTWRFAGGLTQDDPMIASDGSGMITVAVRSIYSTPNFRKFTEGAINWQAWNYPGGVFTRMSLATTGGVTYLAGTNPWRIYWYRSSDGVFTPVGLSSMVAGALSASPR